MMPSYHHLNASNHYNSNRNGNALSTSVDSFGSGIRLGSRDSERMLSNLSHGSVDSNPLTSFNLPPLQTEHSTMNQESSDSRRYNSLWSPEIGDIRLLSNTSKTFVASIQQGPVSYAAVPIFQNMARNDSSPLSSNESIKANPNRILPNHASEYITEDEISPLDVIPEAGAHGNNHYGNQLYRKVTFMSRDTYKRIPTKKRTVKGSFSRLITQFCLDMGCRFLSPAGEGLFKVMTLEEARSKVAQRFREKKEMWIDGVKVDEAALFTRILEWTRQQEDEVKREIDEASLINRVIEWNSKHNM